MVLSSFIRVLSPAPQRPWQVLGKGRALGDTCLMRWGGSVHCSPPPARSVKSLAL